MPFPASHKNTGADAKMLTIMSPWFIGPRLLESGLLLGFGGFRGDVHAT